MSKFLLLATTLSLLAGCATTPPETQYQIGETGGRHTKNEAERAYAGQSPVAGSTPQFEVPPKVLSSKFPDYPRHLVRADIDGKVVVRFTVNPDGSVSDPAIQGNPPPELAALTLDAIMKWKFAPATTAGVPVRARVSQAFLFRME